LNNLDTNAANLAFVARSVLFFDGITFARHIDEALFVFL